VIDRFYFIFSERFYFLISIFVVMFACMGLSMSVPGEVTFWYWALAMCFGASWFDAALGSYRTHFSHENLASMAASVNVSYRVGMILFQAGLVMVAYFVSWQAIYVALSLLCWLWVFGVFWGHQPVNKLKNIQQHMWPVLKSWLKNELGFWGLGYFFLFHASYFWIATILLGYFRVVLGIEAIEVAAAMKFYGVGLTLLMSFVAGYWIKKHRFKHMAHLFWVQLALWGLILILMNNHLPAHTVMVLLISIENISHGFFATMAVALILHCANKNYPATTMAILTSVCLMSRLIIGSLSGWMFEYSLHGFSVIFMGLAIVPIIFLYRSPLLQRLHRQG
jgi:MFS family permease